MGCVMLKLVTLCTAVMAADFGPVNVDVNGAMEGDSVELIVVV